jgi:AcrR family transcriptional regulator
MAKPESDLVPRIREKTLALLFEKAPEEITMRDIAKACNVTATSIYYYYKDKDTLFTDIKLICLANMHKDIQVKTEKKITSYKISHEGSNLLYELQAGLEAFRDWAFENPRIAILIMGRFKPDAIMTQEDLDTYYESTFFGQSFLEKAAEAGIIHSYNTMLDTSLCVSALWGAIESVLLKLTVPQYWSKQESIDFTDKMIELLLTALSSKSRNK